MTTPRVSVLLPVRDAADTLSVCLRSIARQTETRFECVLVDDGSSDGSLAVARAFAERDARFRVIARAGRGLVAALQCGIAACRAPLVARMDADDCMDRSRLACQTAALEDARLSAVGSHVRLFPRARVGPGMRAYEHWLASIDSPQRVLADAFIECPIAHPTLMIRREVIGALPYRDVPWPEDYDLILRLLAAGHQIGVVAAPLLAWRQREGRLSRTSERYSQQRFTQCKAAFLADGFLAGVDRYRLWGYGDTGRTLARALRDHGKHLAAIVELHPGRVGRIIQGAPVIPPAALGPPDTPLLVSVAGLTPRTRIRTELARHGYRECRDYLCTA